ncbi:protein arginine N-methyltransferase 5-like protein [Perkinsela sp. CCAP 1560/4]|nr:protein arginine N-methyltransferase 5-like protein [Perkinsela sp. CCAP 1560/4]|eukprot:KNH07492.1 protein arginine N-methyltransferase 5-like protein [Perkinsela sp. CCAP 1560/4]
MQTPPLTLCTHDSEPYRRCRLCTTLQALSEKSMDFAVVPLDAAPDVYPGCRNYSDFAYFDDSPCVARSQYESSWEKLCVGRVQTPIQGPSDLKAVEAAAMYSLHIGMRTILIDPGVGHRLLKPLARLLNELMNRHKMSVWYVSPWDQWKSWNQLRFMCGHNPLLGVCPRLPLMSDTTSVGLNSMHGKTLPSICRYFGLPLPKGISAAGHDKLGDLWLSEPLRAVYAQQPFAKGHPHSALFPFLLRKVPLIVHKTCIDEFRGFAKSFELEKEEIFSIFRKTYPDANEDLVVTTAREYHDGTPLAPLRPLQENLENGVYEAFERDSVKYSAYQKAIAVALQEIRARKDFQKSGLNVAILGAGRGPLVTCMMEAAYKIGIKVDCVHIFEKNKWACRTLEKRFHHMSNEDCSRIHSPVIQHDFRKWKPDRTFDLAISELLGSFGCNEASPECLVDTLPEYLGKRGLSIPQRYTSYLAPVQAAKTHESLLQMSAKSKDPSVFERLHVVNLRDAHFLGKPVACFEFDHGKRQVEPHSDMHNEGCSKFCSLTFIATEEGVLHGFAGQFDCTLFGTEGISTVEGSRTAGLVSWFSTYLPLRNPMRIGKDDRVTVNLWRISKEGKLWYEWNIEEPHLTGISNSGGVHDFLDLS